MKELGAYQAMNLDGGGSSTMIVRSETINRPSDSGGDRAVSNCILVVSTGPCRAGSILENRTHLFRDLSKANNRSIDYSSGYLFIIRLKFHRLYCNGKSRKEKEKSIRKGVFMPGDFRVISPSELKLKESSEPVSQFSIPGLMAKLFCLKNFEFFPRKSL